MRIVHVSCNDLHGSRFNGHDMQIAFNKRGISCKQFVMDKYGNDLNTIPLFYDEEPFLRWLCMKFESDLSIHNMVLPYGWRLLNHPEFKDADVVHYHCIHNYVLSLAMFRQLTLAKPSVLTLHDPWFFTGHCVHPLDCDKWEREKCINCSHLDRFFPMKENNANYMWEYKKEVFSNIDIDIVVSSKWMLDLMQRSPITSHIERVHLIPFGIDTNLFYSKNRNKSEIRKRLGIGQDDVVLCFRSETSLFKGVPYIQEMLDLLNVPLPVTLLTVGEKGLIKNKKYNLVENGRVNDDEKMADFYAAADIFLMPSTAEAFGLMAIEAMSSELPIIVTQGTALPEVTFAPECGVSIERDNAEQFTKAVTRLIEDSNERRRRGELGRKLALENYKVEDHYKKMLELYESITERKRRGLSINNIGEYPLSRDLQIFYNFSLLLNDLSEKYMELTRKAPTRISFKRKISHVMKKLVEKLGLKAF